MKKRIMTFKFCILLFMVVLFGCKNNKSEDKSNNVNTDNTGGAMSVEVTDDNNANADNVISTATTVAYKYEQDLNIISDNHRNYYEIFVYSFVDSDGNGIGDFNGIISKLDYIHEMGFNGIWLMPIMTSPTYHKYDQIDYYDVDPQYGTLDDFKNLLAECEKRDIKLIIDFVFNHTSNQHPWFKEAVVYLEGLEEGQEPDLTECPYVGYYNFTKEYNGSKFYQRVGKSDWYYECVFYYQQPDLALDNPAVREEIEKITKFWLDMGVGGFRLDAVKEFFSGERDRNTEVLKWFTDYVRTLDEDAYIVGEAYDDVSLISSFYESGITSLFNFPMALYNGVITSTTRQLGTSNAASFAKAITRIHNIYSEKNPNYIDAPFISNHDTTRISAQCMNDPNLMKMAAGLLLTMNGSPFVYYGEEIGMNSQGNKDENKRLPMHWSVTDKTGLTKAPKGADEVVQKFAPLDEQLQDPLSILNYYKRALRIRNENPEIARGEFSVVEALTEKDVCAIKKVYEGSEIVIVYNINNEATTVDLKKAGYEALNIRGYLSVDGSEVILTDEGVLEMPLYSIVILK